MLVITKKSGFSLGIKALISLCLGRDARLALVADDAILMGHLESRVNVCSGIQMPVTVC